MVTLTGLRGRLEAGLARVGIKGRVLPVVGVGAGVIAAYAAVALLHRSPTSASAPVAAPGSIGSDWASGLAGGLGPGDPTVAPVVYGAGQVAPNTGFTQSPPPLGSLTGPLAASATAPTGLNAAPAPSRDTGQSSGSVAPTSFGTPITSSFATTPGTTTPAGVTTNNPVAGTGRDSLVGAPGIISPSVIPTNTSSMASQAASLAALRAAATAVAQPQNKAAQAAYLQAVRNATHAAAPAPVATPLVKAGQAPKAS